MRAAKRKALKALVHREGATNLLVPEISLIRDPPPTSPVFFNPAAALNRDISVAITGVTGGKTFCDSMAGVGSRGIRVANEAGNIEEVTLVDFNGDALKLAKRSAALNRVARKCEFSQSETSSYLFSRSGSEERFDYVDVDPFGTPARQMLGALAATTDGGVLSVTATDTAALCGVYPKVSRRRYGSTPLNNHFHHETGLRILAAAIARQAGLLDIGIEPLAAHSTRHYLRVFVRVHTGATRADQSLARLGHVAWCTFCGHTVLSGRQSTECEKCGKAAKAAGPLWTSSLCEEETASKAMEFANKCGLDRAGKVLASLAGVNDFPPWSFSIEKICSTLRMATVPEARVREWLVAKGYKVLRSPFESTGIKTDCMYRDVLEAVRSSGPMGVPERLGNGFMNSIGN